MDLVFFSFDDMKMFSLEEWGVEGRRTEGKEQWSIKESKEAQLFPYFILHFHHIVVRSSNVSVTYFIENVFEELCTIVIVFAGGF